MKLSHCFTLKDGENRSGVCSTYLNNLNPNDEILLYFRSTPTFHLPITETAAPPLILVGPGEEIRLILNHFDVD